MCGRFALDAKVPELRKQFDVDQMEIQLEPHYNVAPGMMLPVVVNTPPRMVRRMKWGLVPHWSREPKTKFSTINARMENLASSAVYRMPFAKHRCLIPATGFYEWKKLEDETKWPYFFRLKYRDLFAFAGLWDCWRDAEGKEFLSCSIITCPANGVVEKNHPRMPVILKEDAQDQWLSTDTDMHTLSQFLTPYDDSGMEACRVSKLVNDPHNDDNRLILPVSS